MFKDSVRLVQFREHHVINISDSQSHEFDIVIFQEEMIPSFISSGKFLHKQYCTCLLWKLLQLKKYQVKLFLQYQCEQISDPLYWLHKLEKLIELNWDIFTVKSDKLLFGKILRMIELICERLETQNLVSETKNPFDFWELKRKIKGYNSYPEKISLLLEAKTEYLQKKPHPVIPNEITFDEKINLEIDLINSKMNLEVKTKTAGAILPAKNTITASAKLNCNLNQFVDIFYQLIYEKQTNGKSIIETDNATIAEILSTSFLDKDGNEISAETVRTILKPSRIDKRPKGNLRFEMKIPE